mmetsp:Transcript_17926/g.69446  ORF Transcript_17926/g.69446 Transcript_17926/m.69446 type:complete len:668 (+) Transcript_17926:812-2815(+)
MLDCRRLAVLDLAAADHLAAEELHHRLVSEADAKNGQLAHEVLHNLDAHARVRHRVAGTGRDHDVAGRHLLHVLDRQLVVADHHHVLAELREVLVQVPGEAVVVVDQQHRLLVADVGRAARPRPVVLLRRWRVGGTKGVHERTGGNGGARAGQGVDVAGGLLLGVEAGLSLVDGHHERPHLVLCLLELQLVVAVEDNAAAGLDVGLALLVDQRAEGDASVDHVAERGESNRACVDAAALLLQRGDELHRAHLGRTRDSASGEDRAECVEGGLLRPEGTAHARYDVHDVRVPLDDHQAVDRHRRGLADAVDVVPAEVHQHDVLRPLLGIGEELHFKELVLLGRAAALAGASDRVGGDSAITGDAHQALRAGADDLHVAHVEVEHVGRGVHRAQLEVDVERMRVGGPRQALRRHGLDDVALHNVLLQGVDHALVALGAHVGNGGAALGVARLHRLQIDRRALGDPLGELVDASQCTCVIRVQIRSGVGPAEGDDNHLLLVEVDHDERGHEHPLRLWEAEHVLLLLDQRGHTALEVAHTVVGHVSDCTALCQGDVGREAPVGIADGLPGENLALNRLKRVRVASIGGHNPVWLRANDCEAVLVLGVGDTFEDERVRATPDLQKDGGSAVTLRKRKGLPHGDDVAIYSSFLENAVDRSYAGDRHGNGRFRG